MNIKAYSFEQNSYSLAEVKLTVAEQLTEPGVYFESFSDVKEMFSSINQIVDNADVILVGVESKAFLKFKPVFIKAFGYTPAYSEKILNRIGNAISDEKIKKAHAYIPDESVELLSDDGAYSGFYINENEQYIVVFPLIADVLPNMLVTEDLSFLKPVEDASAIMDAIVDTDQSSGKAESIINNLRRYDLRLAIPSTPAAKTLKADIRACEDSDIYVFFTPFVNDSGINDPKQYAADLAKSARELRSAELGATISNIFREKKGDKIIGYYTYISVATSEKIVIKKLFAEPDKAVENLVLEATNELYTMIDKYIGEIAFKLSASADDIEKYEGALIEAEVVSDIRPEATVSKKGVIAAIIAIIAAIILCLVLTFGLADVFVSPVDAPANENLQTGNPVPTIVENDETESTLQYIDPEDISILGSTEPESDTSFDIPTTIPSGINVTDQNTQGGNSGNNSGSNSDNTTQSETEEKSEQSTSDESPETTPTMAEETL